ncbi:MAG: Bifunctional protein GlmU [Chlamydiia bacterium]|nr:Bifunctional protein GlmU [Chlamydiia bacterium]
MINTLKVEDFFNLESCSFKDLFSSSKTLWDALSSLEKYINESALGHIESDVTEHATLVNASKISIGKNTSIFPGAYIEGPCIIGQNVQIGHSAYIRPYSLIGDFCNVGHSSEIKHSIMLPHSKAPHFNYVGDSILGSYVNLGAGVILANYKLNGSLVTIKHEEKKVETGLRKFGAIIGDDSSLGCNSVTSPGTLLSKGFFCKPCSSLQGYYHQAQNKA